MRNKTSGRRVTVRRGSHRPRPARRLLGELLERRLLLTAVTSVDPPANSHVAASSADITATFDANIEPATATGQSFSVQSKQRGRLIEPVSATNATVTVDLTAEFFPGEVVAATVTPAVQAVGGQAATPYTWQFRAGVAGGDANFVEVHQSLGDHRSRGVELGDLDGDGDLDAFVANVGTQANLVWINEGGQFSDSGQLLGDHASRGIELGDLDGDGDLDAFVSNRFQGNRVWINDGGQFVDSGQSLGDSDSYSVSLGDLDGDGDLDAYIANLRQPNRVWLNEGGQFTDSGQILGNHASERVSLGDFDSDGDLDAFVGNSFQGNRLWLNTGGVFADSGQSLGDHDSCGIALGDVDGDGDLDAFVANSFQGNRVWVNDGSGVLSDSGQSLGDHDSWGMELGDVDGDGDLDAFVTNFNEGNRVWLNDGGVFTDSEQDLGKHFSFDVALGDLDGDGDLDAFVVNRDQGNRVWLNRQGNALLAITAADAEKPEGDTGVTPFTFSVSRAGDTAGESSVGFSVLGSGAHPADAADFGGELPSGVINFAAGETNQTVTIDVTGDLLLEQNDTFSVVLSSPSPATTQVIESSTATTGTIQNDDIQSLLVTSLTPTDSGFVAEFSSDLERDELNLYDAQAAELGAPDAVLQGATVGPVSGSLVVDASLRKVSFVKTGDPLVPDLYTVTLRSAIDGFVDRAGLLLDGDESGTAGGDFSTTFTISEPAANAVRVGVPDFARGPGQDVNLPADAGVGIPLTLSEGAGVRNVQIQVDYDPSLLVLSGATAGAALPEGSTVVLDTSTAGTAVLSITSTADLPPGGNVVANLQASIPAAGASASYGRQQVLDIHSVVITDASADTIPSISDDAVHVVTFFGEVSGNGRINATDASQVARLAALVDTGLAATPRSDPLVLADVSGNGVVNAADASLVAQAAALIEVPEIPGIPGEIVIAGLGGPASWSGRPAARETPAARRQRQSSGTEDFELPFAPAPWQASSAEEVDWVMGCLDGGDDQLCFLLADLLEEGIHRSSVVPAPPHDRM